MSRSADIDMPAGVEGVKLAAIIRTKWPPIEIILVSGHPTAADLSDRAIFFPKPYKESEIISAIRRFTQ